MNKPTSHAISQTYRVTTCIGLLLALFTLICRFCPSWADWYALHLYPGLSAGLSWMVSGMSYNLEEPVIGLLIVMAIGLIVRAIRHRWGVWRCLRYELTLVLWVYVWFYMGWCVNYSRSSLYVRSGTEHTEHDQQAFRTFLADYTEQLNASWTADTISDPLVLEAEIKHFYAQVPAHYGLATPRSWQHPKHIWLNGLYSRSSILGFMAPLFSESCLNADMLPCQYPSVYAHEYAHLLGISNEAEANWWAFHACTASSIPAVRYSGYFGIFNYIYRDVLFVLTPEELSDWTQSIRPEIFQDLSSRSSHWVALRSEVVTEVHQQVFDTFLKSNSIAEGRISYSKVIELLLDIPGPMQESQVP